MTRVKRAAVGGKLMTDVLVVEDGPLVRQMITYILRDAGLNVAEADSADAALGTLEAASRLPDVLVTGIELGRGQMDGRKLAGKLRRRSPSLAVIYLAEHSAAVPEQALDVRERYLTKPFEPARLAQLVCEMAPPCPNRPRVVRGRPVMR
jgi:CheY-like chemotaxis protein